MHMNCIYFFALWNLEKFRIDISGKILDSPIRNSKYAHIQKSIIQKKYFGFTNPYKKICILDLEIHNSKKCILDPPIRNRIRLSDSAI